MPSEPQTEWHWVCPLCRQGVVVAVDLQHPPTHLCSERNGRRCRLELDCSEPT